MERAVGHGLGAAPWERQADGDAARARPPGRRVHGVVAHRAGTRLPGLDDVRRRPGAAGRRGARQGVDAAAGLDDLRPRPAAPSSKRGVLAGMGMTEKQGGSDVRANVTEARPTSVEGEYTLHGHKWFTSAPMNDVFLVLAQAEARRDLLPRAAGAARRHPQPDRRRPAQGQARQPLQRLLRARAGRHPRGPARRRGSRGPDDHRDGRRHPARLRARLGVADAARGLRGRPGTPPTARRSARCWSTSR